MTQPLHSSHLHVHLLLLFQNREKQTSMAQLHQISTFTLLFLTTLLSSFVISHSQPLLSPVEQASVYRVLDSLNPDVPWRTLFPDDLCSYGPHGVVCDFFANDTDPSVVTVHVSELSFGYVSDYTPNPPCSSTAVLSPLLFSAFPYLRKLFFYRCFNETTVVSVPGIPASFGSGLEELVFIDNPSLVSPLSGILRNFTSLRRAVLTGNGFYGNVPDSVADMVNLEELTLSGNQLGGEIPVSFEKLKKLKVLDLGGNSFAGKVPESVGSLSELLKLDLSSNGFSGEIRESLKNLRRLELLDLSYNRFNNSGVPLFLSEMTQLRTVSLSGNMLGGQIPEIWSKLGGILGIGLSGMGLVGKIPASMGVYLRNVSYLGLDNNKLEGTVPQEFGLLESVNEINLENNSLSGRVSFSSAKFGHKMKLYGNPQLCVDDKGLRFAKGLGFEELKVCSKQQKPNSAHFTMDSSSSSAVQVVVPSMVMVCGFLGMIVLMLN
ncbi:piriformospora indica-insensitive protein 2 [Rosa rugosa]|uniref:piriformospora indica-insensitive protein 2 n=1 Tax=Rosa rugosa TaxID=74645 RepID=UPI002B4163AE|nr:piriformospora indica-insensitive protein 2 [Rosa rugosa]